jgi:formylglycine-generating enzyme required for sulfatase activity
VVSVEKVESSDMSIRISQRLWGIARGGRLLMLLLTLACAPAWSETRVALVIGNGAYETEAQLTNPANDARAVSESLRRLDFIVMEGFDLDRFEMKDLLWEFGEQAQDADVALLFFAGHGIQVEGTNYLLPTDVSLGHERELRDLQPLTLDSMIAEVSQAERLGMVILDACRDNPFTKRLNRSLRKRGVSMSRGLGKVERQRAGTLVAFATEANDVADDGVGGNSPYTSALLQHLETPGLELRLMFGRVRDTVMDTMGQEQEPVVYDKIGGYKFCFAGCGEADKTQVAALLMECSAHFEAGRLSGSTTSAVACYRQVLRVDRGNVEALSGLSRVADRYAELVSGSLEQGNHRFADNYLKKLQQLSPEHPTIDELQSRFQAFLEANPQIDRSIEDQAARPTQPGYRFSDPLDEGGQGPEMIVVPGGRFFMGSPPEEKDRNRDERIHEASIAQPFAMSVHEITVGDFRRFVKATGYRTEAERKIGCIVWDENRQQLSAVMGLSWKRPDFYQSEQHPVTCVSWNDAVAYSEWLSKQTGQRYRLPTESEWEYAARGDTETSRFWGDSPNASCDFANAADLSGFKVSQQTTTNIQGETARCEDGYVYAAPVGSFRPNGFGLKDVLGNVGEWTCSPYSKGYDGAQKNCADSPTDSGVVMRGGSWRSSPPLVRSALREPLPPHFRFNTVGFRLVKDMREDLENEIASQK